MKNLLNKIIIGIFLLLIFALPIKATTSPSALPSMAPRVKTTKKITKPNNAPATSDPQIKVETVQSKKMQRSIKNLVVVPKTVIDDANTKCPVIYLLHGYGDDHLGWSKHIELASLANQYGIIIVCPDVQNSWYYDSPIDSHSQYETYVTRELREYIESHYPTINDSKHRAITGLSMGGHGALWLGFRHPDIYGSCGSMSGAVDIMMIKDHFGLDKVLGKYAQHQESWKKHSVVSLVPGLKNGQNIIIDDGKQDVIGAKSNRISIIEQNRALHKALEAKGIKHHYSERAGQHSWNYWVVSLNQHLAFFDKCFKK